jgi:hypothetical protein
MLRTGRTLLILAASALASLLSACGGGNSSDVKDTLKQAFSTPIKSAKVNLDVQIDLEGIKQLKGPVRLSLDGPFVSGAGKTIPKFDWDISGSASGQNFTAGLISTGDNVFVSFQGQSYELGASRIAQINRQIAAAAKNKDKQGLGEFGISPSAWLTDAKDEGSDKVAGTDTNHVSAAVDVGKFLDDLNTLIQKAGGSLGGQSTPQPLSADTKEQIRKIVKNPRFDVYVGKDDHIMRRLSADLSFEIPKDQQASLSGLESGKLSFSIEFTEVGQPQTISAPKNSKPIDQLLAQLGGLAGALGGSGGAGSGGAGAGAGADALQKYSECLQKADPSKPEELQACADLLK